MLEAYKGSEHNRVCAAAMKLAAGDIRRLSPFLSTDYRDTLAYAEYPGYFEQAPGPEPPPDAKEITEADWQQYWEWFKP